MELEEEDLLDALDELIEARVIKEDQGYLDDHYSFKNIHARTIVYETMSRTRRRVMHKKVGEALEKLHQEDMDSVLYNLANHFTKGRDPEKGVQYSIMAGDKASELLASEEAFGFYSKAVGLLGDSEKSEESQKILLYLLMRLGGVCDVLGRWEESIESFERAVVISGELDDGDDLVTAHNKLGSLYSRRGQWDKAISHYRAGEDKSREIDDKIGLSNSSFGLSMVYYKKGDYEVAVEGINKSLDIIGGMEGDEKDTNLARFTRMLGAAYYRMGELDKAEEHFMRALEVYINKGDKSEIGSTKHRLGMLANRRGEYEKALGHFKEAQEDFDTVGDIFKSSKNLINLGETYFNMGDTEKALENYEKAESINRRIGNTYGLAIAIGLQGRAFTDLGDYGKAEEYFQQNKKISEELENMYGLAIVHRDMGVLYYKQGKKDEAVELMKKSLAIFEEIKSGEAEEARQKLEEMLSGQ